MDPKYLRDKNEEEIDIIELLTRVKNGNAPREIKIKKNDDDRPYFVFNPNWKNLGDVYRAKGTERIYLAISVLRFDTKFAILDKPKIEELGKVIQKSVDDFMPPFEREPNCLELKDKINEIIRYINKENKE